MPSAPSLHGISIFNPAARHRPDTADSLNRFRYCNKRGSNAMKHHRLTITLLAASLLSPLAMAEAKKDTEMLKLASASGCMTCHSIEADRPAVDGSCQAIQGQAWCHRVSDPRRPRRLQPLQQPLEGQGQRSLHAAQCRRHYRRQCPSAGELDSGAVSGKIRNNATNRPAWPVFYGDAKTLDWFKTGMAPADTTAAIRATRRDCDHLLLPCRAIGRLDGRSA